jgi:PEP-CTERM motif
MRALGVICGLGCATLLCPPGARAEPIALALNGGTGVYSASAGSFSTTTSSLDLGTIALNGGSSVLIYVDGLAGRTDYSVTFQVEGNEASPFTMLTAELLDPLSDGFDAMDSNSQPSYVPVGYSTSNNTDGLSFAWNSGFERSATFATGGLATLHVNEDTHAHDLLAFHGFGPGAMADVTFGVRDNLGSRGFILRLSTDGSAISSTPEPASLLLLATGLAGLARFGRRRQAL